MWLNTSMPEHEFDLRYVNTCLGALSHYLKTDQLDYPVGLTMPMRGTPYPRLTPGNLLFYIARLKGARDSNNLNNRLTDGVNRAEEEFDVLLNEWAANWNKKVFKEIITRVNQWSNYLDDLMRDREEHVPYYKTEVRTRTLIDLLEIYCVEPPPELAGIKVLDQKLKTWFSPGDFIWEEAFSSAFPEKTYWYLWGNI